MECEFRSKNLFLQQRVSRLNDKNYRGFPSTNRGKVRVRIVTKINFSSILITSFSKGGITTIKLDGGSSGKPLQTSSIYMPHEVPDPPQKLVLDLKDLRM